MHAHQSGGHELLPALMESGTYAIDPEPSGPPWRVWSEIEPRETEARQVFCHTVVRLPAVRRPWLREIYDRAKVYSLDDDPF